MFNEITCLLMLLLIVHIDCLQSNDTELVNANGHVIFEDCGSPNEVLSVDITSCTIMPCYIPRNVRISVRAEFECGGSLISFFIKHEVYWIINNVRTRAKVSPDGCNGHLRPVRTKLGCAVTGELVVASTLPTVRGTLLWHSKSLLGRTIFCIKVPIFVGE